MRNLLSLFISIAIPAFVSCSSAESESGLTAPETALNDQLNLTQCVEPRPEMCTREYRPVCANKDTDIRCFKAPCPATENVTYSNACEACADPKVISYVPEACEE